MIRDIGENDLPSILRWRNHPDVREVMFTSHVISEEEHYAWWERIRGEGDRRAYLFEHEGAAIGVVTYYRTGGDAGEWYWGFFLDPGITGPKRLAGWIALEEAAIAHAFGRIGARVLRCESLARNLPALAMHARLGFAETRRSSREVGGRTEEIVEMSVERKITPPPLRVAFLGSANLEELARRFVAAAGSTPVEPIAIPFGQWRQELADPDSALRSAEPDLVVFAERIEELGESEAALDDYFDLIARARENLTAPLFVLDFAPVRPSLRPLSETLAADDDGEEARLHRANRRLTEKVASLADVHLLPLSRVVRSIGGYRADPGAYWSIGRFPFSSELSRELATTIWGAWLDLKGKTVRAIVLDLDNTLWGGVIGDDGMGGIRLGGDYPGNVFRDFQTFILGLKRQGLALAICSKNTAEVAWEAIRNHPEMVLREGDFACAEINWKDKASNLARIRANLNLGMESLMMLDDSPYERDALRRAHPGLYVPELPEDPALWLPFLVRDPRLARLRVTAEDRSRAESYRAENERRTLETKFGNREEFLASLGMRLEVVPLDETNRYRIAQLVNKTNQFNTTTRRYAENELVALAAEGHLVLGVSLSDKFSARETIGAMVVRLDYPRKTARLDLFVLSCRVLGRQVETATLAWLCARLADLGYAKLEGEFIPSPKNAPAKMLFPDHGFFEVRAGEFALDIETSPVLSPDAFKETSA